MKRWTHHPLSLALRGLLVALWVASALFAPAHAAIDALEDPCLQTVAADTSSADVSAPDADDDLDQKFHALHDCGTCHAHVLVAPVQVAAKPRFEAMTRVIVRHEAVTSDPAAGPFRPPRA